MTHTEESPAVPRPLINRRNSTYAKNVVKSGGKNASQTRLLTGNRSETYRRALAALDAAGQLSAAEIDRFIDDIRREFADRYHTMPIGIVGRCYLGVPYEVHTLTLDGSILAHYRRGQALPGTLERARSLAESGTYLAVEVYADRMICTRNDGSAVTLENDS